MKVSQLMGMDVYTDKANYVGKVYDIIIDLQKGEVVRLTLEPIKAASKEDAKRIFKEKTIMYKSVKSVDKIILISGTPGMAEALEEEEPAAPSPKEAPATPYSYRYRRA